MTIHIIVINPKCKHDWLTVKILTPKRMTSPVGGCRQRSKGSVYAALEEYFERFFIYMKVSDNSLELIDKISFFVVSPPKGGEMGVYMKVPGNSLEFQISFHSLLSHPQGG